MLDLSWAQTLSATLVMALGALVQASVGFGCAVIAAPILLLLHPVFVPGPIILAASLLSFRISALAHGFRHVPAELADTVTSEVSPTRTAVGLVLMSMGYDV